MDPLAPEPGARELVARVHVVLAPEERDALTLETRRNYLSLIDIRDIGAFCVCIYVQRYSATKSQGFKGEDLRNSPGWRPLL